MKKLFLLLALFSANLFATPVNINKADAPTIVKSLKGIGAVKAKAIVDYRKKNGAYKTADDLLNVKGIGEKTLLINKPDILLKEAGATTVDTKKDAKAIAKKAVKVDAKKEVKADTKKTTKTDTKKAVKVDAKKEVKADTKKITKTDTKKAVKVDAKKEVKADTKKVTKTTSTSSSSKKK